MHNEVFQSAQVVRCLDERLALAAWARRMVRSASAETGNWSAYTVAVPTEPLLVPTQVVLGYYGIASGKETQLKRFPPPPPTWDADEVREAQRRAKAEAERQEGIRRAEQAQADRFRAEERTHNAAADKEHNAANAAKARNDEGGYNHHKSRENAERSKARHAHNQANHHQRLADAAAHERDRQYAIERCLPLVREAQLEANSIRDALRAHIQDTIKFFAPVLRAYHEKMAPWHRLMTGELALPRMQPLTLRSHEGFDREARTLMGSSLGV